MPRNKFTRTHVEDFAGFEFDNYDVPDLGDIGCDVADVGGVEDSQSARAQFSQSQFVSSGVVHGASTRSESASGEFGGNSLSALNVVGNGSGSVAGDDGMSDKVADNAQAKISHAANAMDQQSPQDKVRAQIQAQALAMIQSQAQGNKINTASKTTANVSSAESSKEDFTSSNAASGKNYSRKSENRSTKTGKSGKFWSKSRKYSKTSDSTDTAYSSYKSQGKTKSTPKDGPDDSYYKECYEHYQASIRAKELAAQDKVRAKSKGNDTEQLDVPKGTVAHDSFVSSDSPIKSESESGAAKAKVTEPAQRVSTFKNVVPVAGSHVGEGIESFEVINVGHAGSNGSGQNQAQPQNTSANLGDAADILTAQSLSEENVSAQDEFMLSLGTSSRVNAESVLGKASRVSRSDKAKSANSARAQGESAESLETGTDSLSLDSSGTEDAVRAKAPVAKSDVDFDAVLAAGNGSGGKTSGKGTRKDSGLDSHKQPEIWQASQGVKHSKNRVKAPKQVDEFESSGKRSLLKHSTVGGSSVGNSSVGRSYSLKGPAKNNWSAMSNNKGDFEDDEVEVPSIDVQQLRDDVNYVFAQDGLFSQKLKNYSPRQGQVDLADTIAQCMGDKKQILMVEAGTGTGKTFSYLVPPILSNCRVVVSTGTKALQDQLVDKDIPNLLRILNRQDLMFMGLKGHSNYICRNMFEDVSELSFGSYARAQVENYVDACLQNIEDYLNHDLHGEAPNFAELRLKLSAEQRRMISCDSATCQRMRNECPYVRHSPKEQPLEPADECFITSSRKFAQQCKVITINHALFFASLGITRPNFGDKSDSGEMAALEKKVQAGVAQLAEEAKANESEFVGINEADDKSSQGSHEGDGANLGKGKHSKEQSGKNDSDKNEAAFMEESGFSHLDDLPDDPAPEVSGRVMNLLPKPDVLVFDEAHTLPEVGRSFYTRHYTRKQLLDLYDDLRKGMRDVCKFVDQQQIDEALHELKVAINSLDLTFRTLEPRRYSILEFKYIHADGVDYVKLVRDEADALGIEQTNQEESNKSDLSHSLEQDKRQSDVIEVTLGSSGKLAITFKQSNDGLLIGSHKLLGAKTVADANAEADAETKVLVKPAAKAKAKDAANVGVLGAKERGLGKIEFAYCNFDSNWKKDDKVVVSESLEQKLDDIEYLGSKSKGGKGYVNYQLLRQQREQEQGLAGSHDKTDEFSANGFNGTNGSDIHASGKMGGNHLGNAPEAEPGFEPYASSWPSQGADYGAGFGQNNNHRGTTPVEQNQGEQSYAASNAQGNAWGGRSELTVPGPLGQYLGMRSEQSLGTAPQGMGQPQGVAQSQSMAQPHMVTAGTSSAPIPGIGIGSHPGTGSNAGMGNGTGSGYVAGTGNGTSSMGVAPGSVQVLQPQRSHAPYKNSWQAQNSNNQPRYYNQRRRQPYHNPQFNNSGSSGSPAYNAQPYAQANNHTNAQTQANAYGQGGANNYGGRQGQAYGYGAGQGFGQNQAPGQFGSNQNQGGQNAYGGQMPLFNTFGGRLNGSAQAPAQATPQATPYMGNMNQGAALAQAQANGQAQAQASAQGQVHMGSNMGNTNMPGYGNWQAPGAAPLGSYNARANQGNGRFNQGMGTPTPQQMPGQMSGPVYGQPMSMGSQGQMGFGQQSLWTGPAPYAWQQASAPAQAPGQPQGQVPGAMPGAVPGKGFTQPNGAQPFGHGNLWSNQCTQNQAQTQIQPQAQSQSQPQNGPMPAQSMTPQMVPLPSAWNESMGTGAGSVNGGRGGPNGQGAALGSSQVGGQGQFGGQMFNQGTTPNSGPTSRSAPASMPNVSSNQMAGGMPNPQVFQAHGQQALLQNSHLPPISNRSDSFGAEGWSGEGNFVKSQQEGVKASNRTATRGGVGGSGNAENRTKESYGAGNGSGVDTTQHRALAKPGPNSYLNKDRGQGKFNRGPQDEDVEFALDANNNPRFNLNFRNVVIRMVKSLQKMLSIINHELDKDDFDKDKLIDAQSVAEQIDNMIAFLTDLMTTDRDKYGNPNCEYVAWVLVRDHNRNVEHVSYDEQGDAQDAKAKEEEELEKSKRRYSRQVHGLTTPAQPNGIEVENEYEIFLAPIEIGKFLGPELRRLVASGMSIVFASATITTNNDFAKFCYDLGLSQSEVTTKIVASPFNYARNARIMYSKDFCSVDDSKRMSKHVAMLKDLIDATPGGVFFLTTSFSALKEAESECRKYFANKRKLYVQGTDSVNNLMAQFRADGRGILIGTSSFWEGVDVPGQALSLVIIDRLPFKQANDPVNKARLEYCTKQGGSPFFQISVPEAIIKLRQGVGRLIRNEKDLGALIILDPRLETKHYGTEFLDSLPPMTRVKSFDEILEFYDFIRDQQRRGLTG